MPNLCVSTCLMFVQSAGANNYQKIPSTDYLVRGATEQQCLAAGGGHKRILT